MTAFRSCFRRRISASKSVPGGNGARAAEIESIALMRLILTPAPPREFPLLHCPRRRPDGPRRSHERTRRIHGSDRVPVDRESALGPDRPLALGRPRGGAAARPLAREDDRRRGGPPHHAPRRRPPHVRDVPEAAL